MNNPRQQLPRFKVGDWVSFPFGTMNPAARVIEDRGPVGMNKRRYYRIELQLPDGEPDRFEVLEEDMIAAAPPPRTAKVS